MLLGQAKDKAIKKIKEFSNAGVVTTTSRQRDYLLPANTFFDTAQKLVATEKRINARYDIVQMSIDNALGECFDIVKHVGGTDASYALSTTANGYYFEVSGNSTVYIEEETATGVWTVIETIFHANSAGDGFFEYKGLIVPSDSENAVRLRFGGLYYYNFRYYALFTENFASVDDVPNYQPWQEHELPSTFYMIKDVLLSEDLGRLEATQYKFIENAAKNVILFPYHMSGEFQVLYFAMPGDVPNDVSSPTAYDLTYEFEVDVDAQEVMILHVCAQMLSDEDEYRAGNFLEQFYVELNSLTNNTVTGTETVTDVYGGW